MIKDRAKQRAQRFQYHLQWLIATLVLPLKLVLRYNRVGRWPKVNANCAIVLGGAPSLNHLFEAHSIEQLRQQAIIVTNDFCKKEQYTALQPQHYVFIDHGYWQFEGKAQANIDKNRSTWQVLCERTNWPLTVYLPTQAKGSDFVRYLQQKGQQITLQFFNYIVYEGYESIGHSLARRNWAAPRLPTAGNAAAYVALMLGIPELYLVGIENSQFKLYTVGDDNRLYMGKGGHSYSQSERFKSGRAPIDADLSYLLRSVANSNDNFALLDRWARRRGGAVYNATPGSMIDTLERREVPLGR